MVFPVIRIGKIVKVKIKLAPGDIDGQISAWVATGHLGTF
jgi:hypothetical protein